MTKCPHGVDRRMPGNAGLCGSCDSDRADMPLDRCPCCNRLGTWGIRSHPKFSVKAGVRVEGELDLVAFYAHSAPAIWALADVLSNDGFSDVIAVEEFDGAEWKEIYR